MKVFQANLVVEQINPREIRMKVVPVADFGDAKKESEKRQIFPLIDGYLNFDSSVLPSGFDRAKPSVKFAIMIGIEYVEPEPKTQAELSQEAKDKADLEAFNQGEDEKKAAQDELLKAAEKRGSSSLEDTLKTPQTPASPAEAPQGEAANEVPAAPEAPELEAPQE